MCDVCIGRQQSGQAHAGTRGQRRALLADCGFIGRLGRQYANRMRDFIRQAVANGLGERAQQREDSLGRHADRN
jgi:hypothetical protein